VRRELFTRRRTDNKDDGEGLRCVVACNVVWWGDLVAVTWPDASCDLLCYPLHSALGLTQTPLQCLMLDLAAYRLSQSCLDGSPPVIGTTQ
jgi:hypothetical protein